MGKAGKLTAEGLAPALASMNTLNSAGAVFGTLPAVKAMTDVTGFGLLGHLVEMCEGSGLSARIRFADVPRLPGIEKYMDRTNAPGGTKRNLASYAHQIHLADPDTAVLLADPQTSGGLLLAVEQQGRRRFWRWPKSKG